MINFFKVINLSLILVLGWGISLVFAQSGSVDNNLGPLNTVLKDTAFKTQTGEIGKKSGTEIVKSVENSIIDRIANIVLIVFRAIGIILMLLFVYAGFLWLTARGDPEPIKQAKTLMYNAVIGFFIVAFGYIIVGFIVGRFI